MTPEEKAREQIDAQLTASGWAVQTKDRINLSAARGVAICELSFAPANPTTPSSWTAKPSARSRPSPKAIPSSASRSNPPSTSPAFRSACLRGKSRCRSATRAPAPKPASPTASIPSRAAGMSSPSIAPRRLLAWVQQEKQLAQRLRELPPLARRQALARADRSHHQPGKILRRRPSARAHPDGHRLGQDLHRRQFHLSPREIRRREARPVPRGSRQSRPSRRSRNSSSSSRP